MKFDENGNTRHLRYFQHMLQGQLARRLMAWFLAAALQVQRLLDEVRCRRRLHVLQMTACVRAFCLLPSFVCAVLHLQHTTQCRLLSIGTTGWVLPEHDHAMLDHQSG